MGFVQWMHTGTLFLILVSSVSLSQDTLHLRDAISIAVEKNQTVLFAAEQEYRSAQYMLESAESVYRPQASLGVSLSRSFFETRVESSMAGEVLMQTSQSGHVNPSARIQQSILTPFGSRTTIAGLFDASATGFASPVYQSLPSITLSYQQPLSLSGMASGHYEIAAARIGYEQASLTYETQKEQLIIGVVQLYVQLWQAQRNRDLADLDAQSARHILKTAEVKLSHGKIAEFEVLNLRAQSRLADDNLAQAANHLQNERISFLRILGRDMSTPVTLSREIAIDSVSCEMEEVLQTALQRRKDVHQIKASILLSRLHLNRSSASFSPSLNLNASYSLASMQEPTFLNSLTMPNHGWMISATLSVPVFDGGNSSSLVQAAECNLSILEKRYSLLVEDIQIDIERHLRTLSVLWERMKSLETALLVAKEASHVAEMRIAAGEISSTEMENVRNRYSAARSILDGTKIAYLLERVQLARTSGNVTEWLEELSAKQ